MGVVGGQNVKSVKRHMKGRLILLNKILEHCKNRTSFLSDEKERCAKENYEGKGRNDGMALEAIRNNINKRSAQRIERTRKGQTERRT